MNKTFLYGYTAKDWADQMIAVVEETNLRTVISNNRCVKHT